MGAVIARTVANSVASLEDGRQSEPIVGEVPASAPTNAGIGGRRFGPVGDGERGEYRSVNGPMRAQKVYRRRGSGVRFEQVLRREEMATPLPGFSLRATDVWGA
jgi:hypothetical protein